MSRRAFLITILLLVAGCTPGEGGGDAVADISATTTVPGIQLLGKVTDPNGTPVPRATVTVGANSAVTAPDGWFDMLATPGPLVVDKPAWAGKEATWDGSNAFTQVAIEPLRLRALRVGAEAAGDDERFAAMLALADETAVNALVFDTKQEGGKVFYETEVTDATRVGRCRECLRPGGANRPGQGARSVRDHPDRHIRGLVPGGIPARTGV